jgi:hypothetical protein
MEEKSEELAELEEEVLDLLEEDPDEEEVIDLLDDIYTLGYLEAVHDMMGGEDSEPEE